MLTFDGTVTIWPSIGNWALPCQSHYIIDHGKIKWARNFTRDEIQLNRESDHRILMSPLHPKALGGVACFGV